MRRRVDLARTVTEAAILRNEEDLWAEWKRCKWGLRWSLEQGLDLGAAVLWKEMEGLSAASMRLP